MNIVYLHSPATDCDGLVDEDVTIFHKIVVFVFELIGFVLVAVVDEMIDAVFRIKLTFPGPDPTIEKALVILGRNVVTTNT
jgi:hypothetical protein